MNHGLNHGSLTVIADDSRTGARDVGAYLSVLRARRWIIVAVATATVLSALFFTSRKPATYSSKASVIVDSASDQAANRAKPNMATERKLAASATVADQVIKNLGLQESRDAVRNGLSLSIPLDTEIIEFHYSDRDRHEAQRRANAFASAYLAYRRQQLLDGLLASTGTVSAQIDALNQRLSTVQQAATTEADPSRLSQLRAESAALGTQISLLQQELVGLSINQSFTGGTVVEQATLPAGRVPPGLPRNGLLGLAVGLLLGVLAALLREALDDRVRGADDLEAHLPASVLGVVPKVRRLARCTEDELVLAMQTDPVTGEAFRRMAANLLAASNRRGIRSILVTSPLEDDGMAPTVATLGAVLARMGKRVVVVSADLRDRRVERLLGVDAELGLTDVLLKQLDPATLLQATTVDRLRVLPAGSPVDDPSEVLATVEIAEVVASLEGLADLVLVEGAPVLAASDVALLVSTCSAVLLVADERRSTRSSILDARDQLDLVNGRLVGSVLVNGRTGARSPRAARRTTPAVVSTDGQAQLRGTAEQARTVFTSANGGGRS